LLPYFDIGEFWPVVTSSNGIVSIPENGKVDQFIYVVSDGMDVGTGQVTVTNTTPSSSPSPSPSPGGGSPDIYTGTLMSSGTAVGTLQITVTTVTNQANGKGTAKESLSITGVFAYQGARNGFVVNSGKFQAGALNGITLTKMLGHGWNLTLKDDFDLQWLATLTGPGGSYSSVLEPQTASGVVHQSYTASLVESGTGSGTGYAFLVLDDATTLRATGKLPDGTPFTGSAGIGAGQGAISSLSGTAGNVLGTIQISASAGPMLTGTVSWKPGANTMQAQLTASPYTMPKAPQSALSLKHGRVCDFVFTRPGGTTFEKKAVLNDPNACSGTPGIEFVIIPRTGLLMGGVIDPKTNRLLVLQGAVMQQTNGGVGYFMEGGVPGRFTLSLGK